jgi:ATP-dependent helicase IRC3
MSTESIAAHAFRSIDLVAARQASGPRRDPAPHQERALLALHSWFQGAGRGDRGSIVVLPTGGGKTFTAVRFLCTGPLSADYKVLWLAETHHLLEQAADAFGSTSGRFVPEAAQVQEPKDELCVRIVSGTIGHCRAHEIRSSDDVVICTLPTAAGALRNGVTAFEKFIEDARGRLCVVFDEAHHAPAPTYSRLIQQLRERASELNLIGLTATPTYTDPQRRGWLRKLFPQEIIHNTSASSLMAARILARPRFEQIQTTAKAAFADRDFAKWVTTYGDLPERVITELAENRARNDLIVDSYLRDRDRYGKTIIFADRWYQCEYLRERLNKGGVRADAIYSHIATDQRGADIRNRRTSSENGRALERFRNGDLDVLINVRMLTEGTDVPNVNTVFLTRQTTSRVLLTQMIGRALRGPKFGGTEDANIVSFVDQWQEPISFASYDRLEDGGAFDATPTRIERSHVQLISIELVRQLSRDLLNPTEAARTPFRALLPLGWYDVSFDVTPQGTEDIEARRELVLVTEADDAGFRSFIEHLTGADRATLDLLSRQDLGLDDVHAELQLWSSQFFPASEAAFDKLRAMFAVARHVAQQASAPAFFPFAERNSHDLDALATKFVSDGLNALQLHASLQSEYNRPDKYWRTIYLHFEQFNQHYSYAQLRAVNAAMGHVPAALVVDRSTFMESKPPEPREPDEATKKAVLIRDKRQCLCCGCTRGLQIDHVAPSYLGGSHEMSNLQTLCKACNSHKGLRELNFRVHANPTAVPGHGTDAVPPWPPRGDVRSISALEQHIRRRVNFYYRCAAVQSVSLPLRGASAGNWQVSLFPGNDAAKSSEGFIEALRQELDDLRGAQRLRGPSALSLTVGDALEAMPVRPRVPRGSSEKRSSKKRRPDSAFMAALTPSAQLAAIVGRKPLVRTDVVKKLWKYIQKNNLQDAENRRLINADVKLRLVFGGKRQVSMFDMTKLVSKHLS